MPLDFFSKLLHAPSKNVLEFLRKMKLSRKLNVLCLIVDGVRTKMKFSYGCVNLSVGSLTGYLPLIVQSSVPIYFTVLGLVPCLGCLHKLDEDTDLI